MDTATCQVGQFLTKHLVFVQEVKCYVRDGATCSRNISITEWHSFRSNNTWQSHSVVHWVVTWAMVSYMLAIICAIVHSQKMSMTSPGNILQIDQPSPAMTTSTPNSLMDLLSALVKHGEQNTPKLRNETQESDLIISSIFCSCASWGETPLWNSLLFWFCVI